MLRKVEVKKRVDEVRRGERGGQCFVGKDLREELLSYLGALTISIESTTMATD